MAEEGNYNERGKATQEEADVFESEFLPYINKWGRRTNLLAAALSFGPALVLLGVFEILPPVSAIIGGFVSVAAAFAAFWIVEPVSYYPVLGMPGTYMAFLSGNISNLRLPCSAAAQESAGVETGTPQGSIISTLGIGASMFVNIIILSIGAFALVGLFQALPAIWQTALETYLVPAIFGAILAQFGRDYPKVLLVAFSIALVFMIIYEMGLLAFLPADPIYVVIIAAVFGSMYIARYMAEEGMIKTGGD
ncbi:hypothetical protein [Natronobacterium texcoconense]|uniref:Uncharacterized protein n=1 Tax=Natronobacterium texcoconense TaxID=1095778 RepID=A0A1H1ANE9_NATTX|nr:hypothetical protein [Natronobacterium texcoconense]SDQ41189.1 hypothetical protein SAMN04489842_0754 [Natronobacterium texcoconense]